MYNAEKFDYIFEKAKALYENSKDDTLKDFPAFERRKFYLNGNRNDFEKLYFKRRDLLSSVAILALRDEDYIPFLEKVITAVCGEYCWALPAHTPGTNEQDKKVVDLFVAETSFALAEICFVFKDKLSLSLISKVKQEIEARLLKNYCRYEFWWEKCNMNWASVCGGFIGGTLIYMFPKEFKKQKQRLLKTMQCYINGFSEDGFCLEGPSYWLYGFMAYTVFADLLYKFSLSEDDLLSSDKVKKVACYALNCFMTGNTSLSFSDCDASFKTDIALQQYLSSTLPDAVPCCEKERMCLYDANTKWMNYYRAIIWSHDMCEKGKKDNFIYSQKANQLIVNKKSYSFAFKGGHNNEPHNHNDLASFIFSDFDGQVLCDLGSGRYTKDYFSDQKRYTVFCNSSLSHNVPIINKKAQSAGEEFCATLEFNGDTAICNFEKAYDEEKLLKASRKVSFKDTAVVITDSFTLKSDITITERFVSKRKAVVKDGELIFGSTNFKFDKNRVTLTIKEEKHTPHEYDEDDITVYCYDFLLKSDFHEISFEISTI